MGTEISTCIQLFLSEKYAETQKSQQTTDYFTSLNSASLHKRIASRVLNTHRPIESSSLNQFGTPTVFYLFVVSL